MSFFTAGLRYFTRRRMLLGIGAFIITAGAVAAFVLFYPQFSQSYHVKRYTLSEPNSTHHVITFTDKGFIPHEITIEQGDTITFSSALTKPFWPASDDHPYHTIYPEFDPRRLIYPPDTWSFKFDKPGAWGFHNHVAPSMLGTVTVITKDQIGQPIKDEVPSIANCEPVPVSQKQHCWQRQLELMLAQHGLVAAFDFFVQLYSTEPDIPKECHSWGHTLGSAAYKQYKETGVLVIRPESSYCGYGYFHSFLAGMIQDDGGFQNVIPFCQDAAEEIGKTLDPSLVWDNCVHGVGHGTSAWLFDDPENWGDMQKVVDQGSAICEKVFSKDTDRWNCYDGVYNEITLDLFNDQFNLSFEDYMSHNDPYYVCAEQRQVLHAACYFEMSGMFWKIFKMDEDAALQYASTHVDNLQQNGPRVIGKIAADWMEFDIVNDSNEKDLDACRKIVSSMYIPCFNGLINGFISHGNPADLHDRAFKFCNASYLAEDERKRCFEDTLNGINVHYTASQVAAACALVPEQYKTHICTDAAQAIVHEPASS